MAHDFLALTNQYHVTFTNAGIGGKYNYCRMYVFLITYEPLMNSIIFKSIVKCKYSLATWGEEVASAIYPVPAQLV